MPHYVKWWEMVGNDGGCFTVGLELTVVCSGSMRLGVLRLFSIWCEVANGGVS